MKKTMPGGLIANPVKRKVTIGFVGLVIIQSRAHECRGDFAEKRPALLHVFHNFAIP